MMVQVVRMTDTYDVKSVDVGSSPMIYQGWQFYVITVRIDRVALVR